MGLFAVVVTSQLAPLGKAPRTGTSMAALAPQLLAKPGADPVTGAAPQPACTEAMLPANGAALAAPGRSTLVSHDGAMVAVTGKAVSKPVRITAQSLCGTSMAKLDQGMTNVTAGPRRGYRFLPHMNFGSTLRITLPYDPALIPVGMSASDIRTFYHDVNAKKWEALPLVKVDTKARTVTSTTTHFTDFTLSTITTPDSGAPINDDPSTIKDIKAADPGANVNLIAPPQASSNGDAHLSYPIQLPQGRHGQQPTLAITYDSGATSTDGWMGLGWDLAAPDIEVDTQFGVPRYDAANETETYLMDGAELTPVANRGPLVPRAAEKVFHSRVEGSFLQIIRHGSEPTNYWWEVTDKNGTRYFYGGDPADGLDPASVLTDSKGDVFRWALKETEDLDGNTGHYSYARVSDPGIAGGTVDGTNMYLASINYTGTGDANTHTFSYYDDAQGSSGNYNGFSSATTVDTGNDNVTAGLLGQGQASALSGNETTTTDGSVYAGFNPAAPDKEGSAGAKVGFSTDSTDGVLAMIDLNGDGKPDKVFEKDGTAYVRVNTTVPGGQVTFSGTASPLPTLSALSHSSSQVFSAGAEAYLGVNVFTNFSQTMTTTDTYFQDVNGDGLPDLVDNGQVLFNHLNGDGIPTFTANSANTPVPVGTGTVDTSGISTPALAQQASADDPLVDTLRVWTAPYTGTVSISGDVSLAQDTSAAQNSKADGVRVAIQQDGTELWSDVIPPDDHSPHVPTGVDALPVTAGDRIYFRVQSGNDGTGDQVSWDPVISYQGETPATDVNGLPVHTYQASKDFTLAGRPGAVIQAPLDGTVQVSGTFHKAAPTTDDVTVEVLKNGCRGRRRCTTRRRRRPPSPTPPGTRWSSSARRWTPTCTRRMT
jgi:hypothetical protein